MPSGVDGRVEWQQSTVLSSCSACVCFLQAVLVVGFKRAELDVFRAMMDELDADVFKVTHNPTRLTTTLVSSCFCAGKGEGICGESRVVPGWSSLGPPNKLTSSHSNPEIQAMCRLQSMIGMHTDV